MLNKKIEKRIVLGIDPGFERLGLAVIEKEKFGKEKIIYSTCVITKKENHFNDRLKIIGDSVKDIIKKYKPNEVAIEKLFFTTNQKTVMGVSEVRGACLYIAISNNLIIGEYTPLQIKIAITGYGRAEKKDVLKMVEKLIDIPKDLSAQAGIKKLDDEIDAIAIALTHIAHTKFV